MGRPKDLDKKSVFSLACEWLESESELKTVSDVANKMKDLSELRESYTNKHIKNLLEQRYGSCLTFKSIGKENLITFQNMTNYLIEERFKREKSEDNEQERVLNVVGNLVKNEIRNICESEEYPTPQDLENIDFLKSWLPPSLMKLLEILIPSELKRIAIGHSVVSGCRRDLMSPLLFGMGVQLDHSFGSKWLNNHLSGLGFSVNNDVVRSYRKATMQSENILPVIPSGSFVQWSADNVDHNSITLDGKNTFHGMGIVASVTPSLSSQKIPIPKSRDSVNVKEISSSKNIPIVQYIGKAIHPASVKLKPFSDLSEALQLRKRDSEVLDLTWIANWLVKPIFPKSCNWSGYMQTNCFVRHQP